MRKRLAYRLLKLFSKLNYLQTQRQIQFYRELSPQIQSLIQRLL